MTRPSPRQRRAGAEFGPCPLCGRPMLDDGFSTDKHHMVPKSRGGKATTRLHRICHSFVHSKWTEAQLEREMGFPEAILADPDAQAFVAWVSKRPPRYYDKSVRSSGKGPRSRKR